MLVDTNFSNFFSDFLKRKQLFGIVETYFPISFIRLVKIGFLPSENSIFFSQSYFATGRSHYWNQEKTVLKERICSCQWTTDLLVCSNHFFRIFQGLLLVMVVFHQGKRFFSIKSFIPALFWVAETVFFSSEVFPPNENHQ